MINKLSLIQILSKASQSPNQHPNIHDNLQGLQRSELYYNLYNECKPNEKWLQHSLSRLPRLLWSRRINHRPSAYRFDPILGTFQLSRTQTRKESVQRYGVLTQSKEKDTSKFTEHHLSFHLSHTYHLLNDPVPNYQWTISCWDTQESTGKMVQNQLGLLCWAFEHTFFDCCLAVLEGLILFLQGKSSRCSFALQKHL